jgi:hypothetical protein
MRRTFKAPPRARVQAVGLTFVAHAAALLLILGERRIPPRSNVPDLQYVSVWLDSRTAPQNVPVASAERFPPQAPIAPAVEEQLQPQDLVDPGDVPVKQRVDWNAQAASAAARFAQNAGEKDDFSPAPQPLREPCRPRSFDEETKRQMAERLPEPSDPDAVGPDPKANCIIVGGFPKCVQKITAKVGRRSAAGDLFKDRLAGKQPVSSVPSPDTCD